MDIYTTMTPLLRPWLFRKKLITTESAIKNPCLTITRITWCGYISRYIFNTFLRRPPVFGGYYVEYIEYLCSFHNKIPRYYNHTQWAALRDS